MLLLSARLHPDAIATLLLDGNALALVTSPRLSAIAQSAIQKGSHGSCDVNLYYLVSYDHFLLKPNAPLLDDSPLESPGYNDGKKDRSVVIFHTSGSTALPKLVHVSHECLMLAATCHGFKSEENTALRNVTSLPLYHVSHHHTTLDVRLTQRKAYGYLAVGQALSIGMTLCIPHSSLIPSGSSVVQLLEATNAASLMTVPSILDEIVENNISSEIEVLRRLKFVASGEAPMKKATGDHLSRAGVPILNHYGATESGPLGVIFYPHEDHDWRYFLLRQDIRRDFRPLPRSNGEPQEYALTVYPPAWESPFEIQDRFIPLADNQMIFFRSSGRQDDVLILANGEKLNPTAIEEKVADHPKVSDAVVFGDNAVEIGIIIRPSYRLPAEEQVSFVSEIWQVINESSNLAGTHAQIISNDLVVVVPFDAVISKTDKGSINRRQVYTDFQSQIAEAYRGLEAAGFSAPVRKLDPETLEDDLRNIIQSDIDSWRPPVADWKNDQDFFELGMNSLQATQLQRVIASSLCARREELSAYQLSPRFIYSNPNIVALANAIRNLGALGISDDESKVIEDMIRRYSVDCSILPGGDVLQSVVLLTGSTGSLGAHILQHLTTLVSVSRVYCFVRSSEMDDLPLAKQERAMREKMIVLPKSAWSKIVVFQVELDNPTFGLTEEIYTRLKGQVTHIIHCAWPMDFNRQVNSFESQFQALQSLLNLARDASVQASKHHKTRFVFASSIAVMGDYRPRQEEFMIPETCAILEDNVGSGYGKAKFICERIIEDCANKYPEKLEACSVRIGQLSGASITGYWNMDEHLPAMIKTSQTLGFLPALDGVSELERAWRTRS